MVMVSNVHARRVILALVDSCCWLFAVVTFRLLTADVQIDPPEATAYVFYGVAAVVVGLVLGSFLFMTYRSGFRNASFEEAVALAGQFALTALIAALITYAIFRETMTPWYGMIIAPLVALGLALLARAINRALKHRRRLSALGDGMRDGRAVEPVLVIGAGVLGGEFVRMADTDRDSQYMVVGILDDDPHRRHLKIVNVPVLGTIADTVSIARENRVSKVVLAIQNYPKEKFTQLHDACERAGIHLFTLPPLSSIVGGKIRLADLREVDISDYLGRREIKTDLSQIAAYINSKRVLVTGAGGSIGSELARQIHRLGPRELVLLDRDESELHQVQLDIYNKGLLDTRDMVLCDIRDMEALRAVFEEHKPEVVFHAAALKHLPMLENYADEGWKTNVLGTRNVLKAAEEVGVGVFVNVSTDKAADPTSVLGRTKRVAERLTAFAGEKAEGRYVSVRFGNVLGSRGSVLWTFRHQIETGGPVTITHPDVERYFMTIPEACSLVLQAGAIGGDGEALVLDMGEPVKIADVAQRLIEQSGKDIEIQYTGLRPGEKMTEVLVATGEEDNRPFHPLISHVSIPPLAPDQLDLIKDWTVKEGGRIEPLTGEIPILEGHVKERRPRHAAPVASEAAAPSDQGGAQA